MQAQMKAINAAIRKHAKAGREAQIAAIVALGVSESTANKALLPDYAGRVGCPDYAIKNNGAEIRRLKKRLAEVEQAAGAEDIEVEHDNGLRVEECPADNRLRLYFPGKPAEDVRTKLKSFGFRWTPSIGCWQAYLNNRARAALPHFTGQEERK